MRKNFVRMILLGFSAVMLIWFVLPLCLSVTMNIGNITGILVAILLGVYALLMPRVHKMVSEWRMHKYKGWLYRVILSIIGVVAALVVVETTCMIRAACKSPEEKATVVVLGCRVYGERPSLSMVERLKAAYDYLEKHEDAVCILSGGQGTGELISEAECMYRWLTAKGIASNRLYKEEKSVSTRENLLFSKQLMEEEGLNQAMAITTSEYHQYRAGKIAESLDIECGAVSANTAVWLLPTFYIRELYGILYEWIF